MSHPSRYWLLPIVAAIALSVLVVRTVFVNQRATATRPATTPSSAPSPPGRDFRIFRSEALGVAIAHPSDFEVGQFAPEKHDDDSFFKDAAVFVPRSVLESRPAELDRLPVGDLPTISVHRADAKLRFGEFAKPEFRLADGPREVYKLPAWPGPYGDRAWVYLLPQPDGRDLLILGHKTNWLGDKEVPTRYDEVIELMLRTLTLHPTPASQPQNSE